MGPFDLTGPEFLKLFIGLLGVAILSGLAIPRWLRTEGRSGPVHGDAELAILAGGRRRFVDATMARLIASGILTLKEGEFVISRGIVHPTSDLDRSLINLPSGASWRSFKHIINVYAECIEDGLTERGLLIGDRATTKLRIFQTLPYLLLLLFGFMRWEIGVLRDKPVGYLTTLLLISAVLACIRFAKVDRPTRAGVAATQDAARDAARLRRAPTQQETGLAVALFGTAVLIGSPWNSYHKFRRGTGDVALWSGCGDAGCGGSGCGGGGCGGCGS